MDFIIQSFQQTPDWLIYLLLAAILLIESSGVPVLNSVPLLFTGALAAAGRLNLGILILAAVLGSTLGACSAYVLGLHYGEGVLLRLARFLRLDIPKVRLAQNWFQRAGGRMIFLSRILPYLRPFGCFPAGISAMPFRRFLFCALSGSFLWCTTLLIIGWELGPRWHLALDLMRRYTIPAIVAVVLLLILSFFVRRTLMRIIKKRLIEPDGEFKQDRDLLGV